MTRLAPALGALLLAAACTAPNPNSCLDDHCSDPALPFCDTTGALSGEPGTCVAVECTAGTFEECRGDDALICNSAGTSYDTVKCEFGCGDTGCNTCNSPECEKRLVPRFAPDVCSELSTSPALEYSATHLLDTTDAATCSRIISQTDGPEICVVRAPTINVAATANVTVGGTRAIAFVADRELNVDGVIDVSANGTRNGPAGGFTKSGVSIGEAGGGAGYRSRGGHGGAAETTGGAANGGPVGMSPTLLTTLFGGPQAASSTSANPPGGAGGAVMFISCRGEAAVRGIVDAGGGGGTGDTIRLVPPTSIEITRAAGGGAGGTIVVQGMTVDVSGELYANGGGGGGGTGNGSRGADANRSTLAAAGGTQAGNNPGDGGVGGTATPPGDGMCNGSCGAGGGSAGYIVVLSPTSESANVRPTSVSPPVTTAAVPTN